jgi:excisionase family DNA binding protein
MRDKVSIKEVAQQLALGIELLLRWYGQQNRQREKKIILTNSYQDKAFKLLTAEEVASILDVSRALVYSMVRRGEIPAVHLRGAVRIRKEDLNRIINSREDKGD